MKLSQLRKIVREELEKYDGGYTDEWNDQRKKNAEVLGYKLSGKSDIKEGATEFWQDMFRPGNIPNKYINQLIKKKGELPSKSHIKSIYKDNGNPSSSQLSKAFKQLAKEKYIRKQGSMWKWESGFAWRTGTELESVNEKRIKNSPLRRNITSTFKDLDKKFRKKLTSYDIDSVASYITSKNRYFPKELANVAAEYFYEYKRRKLKINQAIQATINYQRGYPYKSYRTGTELESVNEGFTKYHIRLTDTPGWYGVWDKKGKQKFEGDKRFVMKHLKKLKTRMGNFQLKSLIDVATKRKGKDITFDVVESINEAIKPQGYSQLNTMAKHACIYIRDLLKALRKQDDNAVIREVHFLASQFTTMEKMLKDKKWNAKYSESVNEGTKAFLAYREMKEALNVAIYGIKKMRKFIDDAPYNPKFNMITKELYKWEIDLEKKWRRVVPQISKISKDKMLESVNEKMSPAQYHSYMQYVFDTQFKTPDEKKMKKSIIKKINVAQKKKGLPLYKESVNEKWSKGLERYKVTLENGKEIDVKVKEGVGLEGIGKLLEKEGLKFEKITKKASRPTLTPESVNEARETAIDIAKRVVKNKQHEKGLDLTTANFIVKIYDAYKEHPNLQRQMKKMPLPKMVKLAYKVMK